MKKQSYVLHIDFCEEEIQEFAKSNFGRTLDDYEISQLDETLSEVLATNDLRTDLLFQVIKFAIKKYDK